MTMSKRPFTKPPTDYSQQVSILKQRGMVVENDDEAIFYLKHLNYYRLAAYWRHFEIEHQTHKFRPGTTFRSILRLYIFDRELRLLLLDAIERIEVSVRAQWAYHLAHLHGSHAHLDSSLAADREQWQNNINNLEEEVERSQEDFIHHLKDKYSEHLPPVWAVCEVMSIGTLSKWYYNLRPNPTRNAIAQAYELDPQVMASWLRHMTIVRNFSAHHSRIWNREFLSVPKAPKTKPKDLSHQWRPNSKRLCNTLTLLLFLMDHISPHHAWRQRLREHLKQNPEFWQGMGLPDNWQILPIWQDRTNYPVTIGRLDEWHKR